MLVVRIPVIPLGQGVRQGFGQGFGGEEGLGKPQKSPTAFEPPPLLPPLQKKKTPSTWKKKTRQGISTLCLRERKERGEKEMWTGM